MKETPAPQSVMPRIISIDLLRGYLLFIIIVDHLAKYPSGYELLTGKGEQWISAAEGFFFISGMMVGFVYGRRIASRGFVYAWNKVWRRASVLYVWSVALTLFFTAWARLQPYAPGIKENALFTEHWGRIIWGTLQLKYIYGWTDFLPYYTIFLAWSPLVLWLTYKKMPWLALAGSLLVWRLRGDSFTMAWQILFMGGICTGYYLPEIEGRLRLLPRTVLGMMVGVVGSIVAAAIYLSNEALHERFPLFSKETVIKIFDRPTLAEGRILLFLLAFFFAYGVFRLYEKQINSWLGWFLLPLGKNSLYTYIVHGFVVYAVRIALPGQYSLLENVIINTAFLGCIWMVVKSHPFKKML